MPRTYGKISTSLWNSRKFRVVKDPLTRLVYLYLHTCPHVNSVGCFVLRDGYAADDIGIDVKGYRKAIDTLSKANLIAFDADENVVRIIDFLRHDPFTGPKHALGALRIAAQLPECSEKRNLFNELRAGPFGNLVAKIDTLSIPYPDGIDSPEPRTLNPEPQKDTPPPVHYPANEAPAEAGGGGSAPVDPTLRERILTACGADPISGMTGPTGRRLGTQADMAEVARWQAAGLTDDEIVAEVVATMASKRDGPPSSLKFFANPMARLAGAKAAPPLDPITATPPKTAAQERRDESRAFHQTIRAVAGGLSAGTIRLDDQSRDPFAVGRRADPDAGNVLPGPVLRPGG